MKRQIYELLKNYRLSDKTSDEISRKITNSIMFFDVEMFLIGLLFGLIISIIFMILNTYIHFIR